MCNANRWRGKRSNCTTCESPNYGSGTQGRSNRPCRPESSPEGASAHSPPLNRPSRALCSWPCTCSSSTDLLGYAPQDAKALPPSDLPHSAKPPLPPTPQLACTSSPHGTLDTAAVLELDACRTCMCCRRCLCHGVVAGADVVGPPRGSGRQRLGRSCTRCRHL